MARPYKKPLVHGVKVREQTAQKNFKCDSCGDGISPGDRYVRAFWQGRPVEMFHIECYEDEFTDAEPEPML